MWDAFCSAAAGSAVDACRLSSASADPQDAARLTASTPLPPCTLPFRSYRLALALAFVASASAFVAPRAGRTTVRMAADLDSMVGVGPESGNKVWVSKG